MVKQDAQKKFTQVIRNTFSLLCELDAFHSVAMKGFVTGVNESLKETTEKVISFFDEKFRERLGIYDKVQEDMYIEKLHRVFAPEYIKNAEACIEAACIVFAHSIIERLIIVLYYYDEMTMAKIAKVLEMSEFELSQNHFSIIAGLKAEMKKIKPKFEPPESS